MTSQGDEEGLHAPIIAGSDQTRPLLVCRTVLRGLHDEAQVIHGEEISVEEAKASEEVDEDPKK